MANILNVETRLNYQSKYEQVRRRRISVDNAKLKKKLLLVGSCFANSGPHFAALSCIPSCCRIIGEVSTLPTSRYGWFSGGRRALAPTFLIAGTTPSTAFQCSGGDRCSGGSSGQESGGKDHKLTDPDLFAAGTVIFAIRPHRRETENHLSLDELEKVELSMEQLRLNFSLVLRFVRRVTGLSNLLYYAIVHPMRAQYTCTISQARKIVITTWVTHKEVGMRVTAYWCVRDSESGLLWRAHEVYMLVLVLVLPLTVMAYCYTAICWEIWRVMKRRYHMTSRRTLNPTNIDTESIPMTQRQSIRNNRRVQKQDDQTEEESRTIRQIPIIMVKEEAARDERAVIRVPSNSSLTCEANCRRAGVAGLALFLPPESALRWENARTSENSLQSRFPLRIDLTDRLGRFCSAPEQIGFSQDCINPIVYGFMSKHFRESFLSAACGGWWICCPRRGYRAPVKRHPSLSQTRTTSTKTFQGSLRHLKKLIFPLEESNIHRDTVRNVGFLRRSKHYIEPITAKHIGALQINVDKRTVREVRQPGKYVEISEIEDVGNFLCFERWRSSRVSAFLTTLGKLKKLKVGTRLSEEVEAKDGKLRKARVTKIWKARKVEFKKYKIR
ncbi:hypothetical protein WN51_02934 [Melipona quadrifasciata]|uniref:Uncharacterized protein n=1 Tax=Melipona quadrifasciata TaxID=166423 RepID=A0A0N0BJV5_9HYME|nr:hypothetical protein WN51_02934 [Melipona quadrifasciata]